MGKKERLTLSLSPPSRDPEVSLHSSSVAYCCFNLDKTLPFSRPYLPASPCSHRLFSTQTISKHTNVYNINEWYMLWRRISLKHKSDHAAPLLETSQWLPTARWKSKSWAILALATYDSSSITGFPVVFYPSHQVCSYLGPLVPVVASVWNSLSPDVRMAHILLSLGICLWHRWSSDSLSTKWVIFGKPFLSQNVSNCETEDIQEVICRLQFKFYPILILNKCSSSSPTLPKLHPWRFNWWLMIHSNHS